eukprot:g7756.t1
MVERCFAKWNDPDRHDWDGFPCAQLARDGALAALHIWFDVAASRNIFTPLPVAVAAYTKVGEHLLGQPPYAHRTGRSVVGAWGFRVLSQLLHSVKPTEGRDFVRAVAGPSAKPGCAGESHAKICNDYLQVHYSTALLCLKNKHVGTPRVGYINQFVTTALPDVIVTKVKEYLGFANEHHLRNERQLLALEKQKVEKAPLSAADEKEYARLTRLCLDSEEQMKKKRELIKLIEQDFENEKRRREPWRIEDLRAREPWRIEDRALALAGELFGLEAAQKAGKELSGRWEGEYNVAYMSYYNTWGNNAQGLSGILLRDMNTIKETHRFSLDYYPWISREGQTLLTKRVTDKASRCYGQSVTNYYHYSVADALALFSL